MGRNQKNRQQGSWSPFSSKNELSMNDSLPEGKVAVLKELGLAEEMEGSTSQKRSSRKSSTKLEKKGLKNWKNKSNKEAQRSLRHKKKSDALKQLLGDFPEIPPDAVSDFDMEEEHSKIENDEVKIFGYRAHSAEDATDCNKHKDGEDLTSEAESVYQSRKLLVRQLISQQVKDRRQQKRQSEKIETEHENSNAVRPVSATDSWSDLEEHFASVYEPLPLQVHMETWRKMSREDIMQHISSQQLHRELKDLTRSEILERIDAIKKGDRYGLKAAQASPNGKPPQLPPKTNPKIKPSKPEPLSSFEYHTYLNSANLGPVLVQGQSLAQIFQAKLRAREGSPNPSVQSSKPVQRSQSMATTSRSSKKGTHLKGSVISRHASFTASDPSLLRNSNHQRPFQTAEVIVHAEASASEEDFGSEVENRYPESEQPVYVSRTEILAKWQRFEGSSGKETSGSRRSKASRYGKTTRSSSVSTTNRSRRTNSSAHSRPASGNIQLRARQRRHSFSSEIHSVYDASWDYCPGHDGFDYGDCSVCLCSSCETLLELQGEATESPANRDKNHTCRQHEAMYVVNGSEPTPVIQLTSESPTSMRSSVTPEPVPLSHVKWRRIEREKRILEEQERRLLELSKTLRQEAESDRETGNSWSNHEFEKIYEPISPGALRHKQRNRSLKASSRTHSHRSTHSTSGHKGKRRIDRTKLIQKLEAKLQESMEAEGNPELLEKRQKQLKKLLRQALDASSESLSNISLGLIYVPMEEQPSKLTKLKALDATDYDTFGSIDSLIFKPKIPTAEDIAEAQEEVSNHFEYLNHEDANSDSDREFSYRSEKTGPEDAVSVDSTFTSPSQLDHATGASSSDLRLRPEHPDLSVLQDIAPPPDDEYQSDSSLSSFSSVIFQGKQLVSDTKEAKAKFGATGKNTVTTTDPMVDTEQAIHEHRGSAPDTSPTAEPERDLGSEPSEICTETTTETRYRDSSETYTHPDSDTSWDYMDGKKVANLTDLHHTEHRPSLPAEEEDYHRSLESYVVGNLRKRPSQPSSLDLGIGLEETDKMLQSLRLAEDLQVTNSLRLLYHSSEEATAPLKDLSLPELKVSTQGTQTSQPTSLTPSNSDSNSNSTEKTSIESGIVSGPMVESPPPFNNPPRSPSQFSNTDSLENGHSEWPEAPLRSATALNPELQVCGVKHGEAVYGAKNAVAASMLLAEYSQKKSLTDYKETPLVLRNGSPIQLSEQTFRDTLPRNKNTACETPVKLEQASQRALATSLVAHGGRPSGSSNESKDSKLMATKILSPFGIERRDTMIRELKMKLKEKFQGEIDDEIDNSKHAPLRPSESRVSRQSVTAKRELLAPKFSQMFGSLASNKAQPKPNESWSMPTGPPPPIPSSNVLSHQPRSFHQDTRTSQGHVNNSGNNENSLLHEGRELAYDTEASSIYDPSLPDDVKDLKPLPLVTKPTKNRNDQRLNELTALPLVTSNTSSQQQLMHSEFYQAPHWSEYWEQEMEAPEERQQGIPDTVPGANKSVRFTTRRKGADPNNSWSDMESIIFAEDRSVTSFHLATAMATMFPAPVLLPATAPTPSAAAVHKPPMSRMATYKDEWLFWDQLHKMRRSNAPEDRERWQDEKTKRMLLWIHHSQSQLASSNEENPSYGAAITHQPTWWQAKQRASVKWLLSKAYGHQVPEELKEPFYRDSEDQEYLKPAVVHALANAELYCLALAHIYGDPNYSQLNHWGVIQALARKGVYVAEPTDVALTETTLIHTSPLRMSAHMAVMEAIMALYVKEMVTAERVVSSIARFASVTPDDPNPPRDAEEALLFWISKACHTLVANLAESLGSDRNSDPEDNGALPSFPEPRELSDLSDGTCLVGLAALYCPQGIDWTQAAFNEPISLADSLYNLQLVQKFCKDTLPYNACHLTLEDMVYMHSSVKQNMLAFLADLFILFEVRPAKCVTLPGVSLEKTVLLSDGFRPTSTTGTGVRRQNSLQEKDKSKRFSLQEEYQKRKGVFMLGGSLTSAASALTRTKPMSGPKDRHRD